MVAAVVQAGSQEWSDDSHTLKAEGTGLVDNLIVGSRGQLGDMEPF